MITYDQLMNFHTDGELLAGYPWLPKNGLDYSGGSLGMGLSVGIGMALSAKRNVNCNLRFHTRHLRLL